MASNNRKKLYRSIQDAEIVNMVLEYCEEAASNSMKKKLIEANYIQYVDTATIKRIFRKVQSQC